MIVNAFAAWIKRFEQTHVDSVVNLEVACNELKQLSTTVLETKFLLQLLLEKGSPKQLIITKQNQLARIFDHISRLKHQDIWNFPDVNTQPDTNFQKQLLNSVELGEV